jgi:hypothetical protein
VNSEIRRKAWPILLSMKASSPVKVVAEPLLPSEQAQVQKDVDRSLFNFDYYNTLNEETAKAVKEQLKEVLTELLQRNKFHYYQGYNDFCSVFLLIMGKRLGGRAAEIASQFLIKYLSDMPFTCTISVFP